jgi:SPP1 family predicted phage head-tail adaptor
MPLAAGLLRESVTVQYPTESRNSYGESAQTWNTLTTRRAMIEAISYTEMERRGQIGGNVSYTVRVRYVPGITGQMRLRWDSREGKILYISSAVERGNREEHELTCEEQAT